MRSTLLTAAAALGVLLPLPAVGAILETPTSTVADSPTISVYLSTADGASDVAPGAPIALGPVADGAVNVRVDDSLTYQTVHGVGASFTDSSATLMVNLKNTNPARYRALMDRLFSPTSGDAMTMWRIPMGSSDFTAASSHWTNADVKGPAGDLLANFALTPRDTDYVIPVVLDALAINPELKIMASPWSAPGWMKSNNSVICRTGLINSSLKTEYYQTWADYFVKWIDAYEARGIDIWAITPQNEPGYCPDSYPGMTWTAAQQVNWVNNYLHPTLTRAGLDPLIFGFDHNFTSTDFAASVVAGTSADVVDGIAWHCYDNDADPAYMTKVRQLDTSRRVLETECSSNVVPTDIIRYSTAEMALKSFQNHAEGVILWNVALDSDGGPHLGGCVGCHPVVRIDQAGSTWDWSLHGNLPSLSHVSRFVDDGATRIDSTVEAHGIVTAAFRNPDGSEALVATNTGDTATAFSVTWNRAGSFAYTLPSGAIATFVGDIPAAAALDPTPEAGRTYRIVSKTSGKPIGVCAGATNDGACLIQWSDDGDPDQRWRLADAGDGYINIVNVGSGKAMDVPDGSSLNGTALQQWSITGTGNGNQQWTLRSAPGGWHAIVNRNSGKAIDLEDGSVFDGAGIQQWTLDLGNPNQLFRFVPYT